MAKKNNSNNVNQSVEMQAFNESPAYMDFESRLKEKRDSHNNIVYKARKVIIQNTPKNLAGAIETYGIDKLIEYANQYVIAHSLLAKAREIAESAPNDESALILPFAIPQERAKSDVAIKIDASKMNKATLNATILALNAGGVKFKIINADKVMAD